MFKPKVSVIVPVYNVANYLRTCLDSILNQDLDDIEIICGDGGSTDGSVDILEEYRIKDPRLKYITKKNSGYGQSVNECVRLAQGEYIGIVESDDMIKTDMYSTLYSLAELNNLDWIRSDIYKFYSFERKEKQLEIEPILADSEYYCRVLNPQIDYVAHRGGLRTWSGIYKLAYIKQFGIEHNETPGGSFQDVGFYLKTLYYAERVYFVNRPFYIWRQDNPNSSINYYSRKLVEKSVNEWCINKIYIDKNNVSQMAISSYYYRKFLSMIWTIGLAGEIRNDLSERVFEEFCEAIAAGKIDRQFFRKNEWRMFVYFMKQNAKGYDKTYYSLCVSENGKIDNFWQCLYNIKHIIEDNLKFRKIK